MTGRDASENGREREGPDLLAPAVVPSPALRAAVLDTIAAATRLAGFTRRLAALFDLPEARAAELIQEAREPGTAWQAIPTPGVRLFHLAGGPRVAAADCGLVRIEPDVRFPTHRHGGDEWSLVLAGEAHEEKSEARWSAGDLVYRPAGSVHAFQVLGESPLLLAVVLDGALEFSAA